MDNDFYKLFKRIIRECNYDNTYKMAWAKALVELSLTKDDSSEYICITLDEIADKFIKYYWNQTIFFDLIQGSNINKIPVVIQDVKELIGEYYKYITKKKPDLYEHVEYLLKEKLSNEYNNCLIHVSKTLKADVSWRFIYIDSKMNECIYRYKKWDNKLYISKNNLNILKEKYEDLFDIINYRWGLILECFNSSPRINKKVKIIDDINIKRNSLNKYKKYLDIENPNKKCFICNNLIADNEISIDHVIPWSYLYSDDIWNLVYVHKSCNSSKNNIIPTEEAIDKLKVRNNKLLNLLDQKKEKGKVVDELKMAIDKDYVYNFWIRCKL